MKARKINGRPLSLGTPVGGSTERVLVHSLNLALRDFADSYLRGAMEYEFVGRENDVFNISTERVAYLIRLLLQCTDDDAVVRLTMEAVDGRLRLHARVCDNTPDTADMETLSAAAKTAGFSFSQYDDGLVFTAEAITPTVFSLYSVPPRNIYLDFVTVFFNM